MKIEVLGTGCSKCSALEELVREIIRELQIDAEIVKVNDVNRIIDYGIPITPGLVIDGVVKVSGRVPSRLEIEGYLKGA